MIMKNKTWKDCAVAERDSGAVESPFGKRVARGQAGKGEGPFTNIRIKVNQSDED
jgi:hypothetical protein